MSVKGKRVIFVGPADDWQGHPLLVEGQAATAFLPGELVVRSGNDLSQSTNAATVVQEVLIAKEYGDHIDKDVDTTYAVGDYALAVNVRSGEFVNVRVAAGTYAKGQPLTSAGNGQLTGAATDLSEEVLLFSDEDGTFAAGDLLCARKK